MPSFAHEVDGSGLILSRPAAQMHIGALLLHLDHQSQNQVFGNHSIVLSGRLHSIVISRTHHRTATP